MPFTYSYLITSLLIFQTHVRCCVFVIYVFNQLTINAELITS